MPGRIFRSCRHIWEGFPNTGIEGKQIRSKQNAGLVS